NDSKTLYLTIVEKGSNSDNQPTTPPLTGNPQSPNPTLEPSSDNDSVKYQYFLVGMVSGGALFGVAVMIGIFLKKRRPTQ
ncbi:MAG: hypothetical protein PVG65_04555, partial [Candidatus Thorarchaeota archaeon]